MNVMAPNFRITQSCWNCGNCFKKEGYDDISRYCLLGVEKRPMTGNEAHSQFSEDKNWRKIQEFVGTRSAI